MFWRCTGLTGGIPPLPSTLVNGASMFQGCTGLSGTCPSKPARLTSYGDMYLDSGVTCDYGQ